MPQSHSQFKEFTLKADIIIVALGKAEFLTADMVKDGVVVIDVGITRVASTETKSGFKLLGDVKYDEVAAKSSFITPVPGGVGPMTIASLLMNTLKASKRSVQLILISNTKYKNVIYLFSICFPRLEVVFKNYFLFRHWFRMNAN